MYNWYFCDGLMYEDIDESVKGNGMEFDAILHDLKTLKGRLKTSRKFSNIHINIEFDELKQCIIEEIQKANISIDIAVAWLSENDICQELIRASENGLKVRILMLDCDSNKNTILNSQDDIDIIFVDKFGRYNSNYMHNKFCVFDSSTVITGSYNWTVNANYNNENIVIILNENIAKKFTIEFNDLVKKHR